MKGQFLKVNWENTSYKLEDNQVKELKTKSLQAPPQVLRGLVKQTPSKKNNSVYVLVRYLLGLVLSGAKQWKVLRKDLTLKSVFETPLIEEVK